MLSRLVSAVPDLGGRVNRADVALALALALPSLLQVLIVHPIAPPAIGVAVALGSTLPIAWRRTRPVAAALAGTVVWLLPTDGYLFLGYISAFFLYYSLGAYVDDPRVVIAVAGAGLAIVFAVNVIRAEATSEYIGGATTVMVPPAVGRFVRGQRARERRLEELTRHLERERDRSAHIAVAEERARIARELHDVISHGVSLIAIQSDAAEAALDRDPQLARTPVRTIRQAAHTAMAEMRRLLDVLGDDDDAEGRVPLPGLAQLPALVDAARAAGVPLTVKLEGEPREIPASVDLSAYRIVQESLTNVRRHAHCAPTVLSVAWLPDAIRIEVRDSGPGTVFGTDNGGHGIVGMRERVRLHGGSLDVGPAADDGFAIRAVLPLPRDGA